MKEHLRATIDLETGANKNEAVLTLQGGSQKQSSVVLNSLDH